MRFHLFKAFMSCESTAWGLSRMPVLQSLPMLGCCEGWNHGVACDLYLLGTSPCESLFRVDAFRGTISFQQQSPLHLTQESATELAPPDKVMLGSNPPIPGGGIFCPDKFKASRLPSGWFIFPDLGNAHSFWKDWNWPWPNLVTISEEGWVNAGQGPPEQPDGQTPLLRRQCREHSIPLDLTGGGAGRWPQCHPDRHGWRPPQRPQVHRQGRKPWEIRRLRTRKIAKTGGKMVDKSESLCSPPGRPPFGVASLTPRNCPARSDPVRGSLKVSWPTKSTTLRCLV